jgi:4-amino-4-deoxy-L-arabinose transferase-like glycosyltransferase
VNQTWLTPNRQRAFLLIIFVLLVSSSIVWTISDQTPPPWDPSDHIRYGYDYYRLLATGDFRGFAHEFFEAPHFYAPLVHLMIALSFLVGGASRLTALLPNFISLAVLLISVKWMGQTTFSPGVKDSATSSTDHGKPHRPSSAMIIGILAAMIASCSHFSAWLLHDAFLDFPLTAAVAGSMALLIRAGDFSSRRNAMHFAVSAGLGLLVKQTFAFFFVLPAAYTVIRVAMTRDRRSIVNLLLAGLVIAAIASIWYLPHLDDVMAIYRENQRAAIDENEAPLYSFDSSFFSVHALLSFQLQVPFALMMIAGLIYSLIRWRGPSLIIYLWLAGGLGMFALVANKDVRYTVPVVPAAALLAACCLEPVLRSRNKRIVGAGYALATGVAAWSLISFFNALWPGPGGGTVINTPRYQWMVFARNYYGFDHRPLPDDWSVPAVVTTVAKRGPQSRPQGSDSISGGPSRVSPKEGASPALSSESDINKKPTLGVVVNLPHLNPSSTALYARLLSPGRAAEPLVRIQWLVVDGSLDRLDECDYVLARTGLDQADWVAPIEREFEQLVRLDPRRFTKLASYPIPLKGAEAVIYQVNRAART